MTEIELLSGGDWARASVPVGRVDFVMQDGETCDGTFVSLTLCVCFSVSCQMHEVSYDADACLHVQAMVSTTQSKR